MPLARIITESVDDSLELTMQLRANGFQVETVAPGAIPQTPADLEVRLEECAAEDVLEQAAHVAEGEELWVFVAPGALDECARPMRAIPLYPPVSKARNPSFIPPQKKVAEPAAPESAAVDDEPILSELEARRRAEEAPATTSADQSSRVIPFSAPVGPTAAPVESVPDPGLAVKATGPVIQIPMRIVAPEPAHALAETAVTAHEGDANRADTKFWRLASACAMLAIAALMVGVNLTPPPPSAGIPPARPEPSAVSQTATSARPPAAQPPAVPASKPAVVPTRTVVVHPASPASRAHPRSRQRVHHSPEADVVAPDTVIVYDRKPASAASKAQPQRSGRPRSEHN